jgi:purine-nucleoside phosphorylase
MKVTSELDERIERALAAADRAKLPRPAAVLSLATGLGLSGRLTNAGRAPFSRLDGSPERWRDVLVHHGVLEGSTVWLFEDAPLDAQPGEPAWSSVFPLWLAGAAGAATLIHVSAGAATKPVAEGGLRAGTIALVRDHLNLSGGTPLVGLGASRLGAQFPDQTRTHDAHLRRHAAQICTTLGLQASECIAACTLGPTLETPAERRAFAALGAEVTSQRLIEPLHAAAHCGLGVLALVLVVQEGDEDLDIARIAARATALAPAVDDLLVQLVRAARTEALERSREGRLEE